MSTKNSDFMIEVENRFKQGKRSLVVYNSSDGTDTIIPWPKGKNDAKSEVFTLSSSGCSDKENFLLIILAPRPAEKEASVKIGFPSIAELNFLPVEDCLSMNDLFSFRGSAMVLNEGPHTWRLKITRPPRTAKYSSPKKKGFLAQADSPTSENVVKGPDDNVTVGDNGD